MAQELSPQQRQRGRMRSAWERALDIFFASLNFILSGPPPRQGIPKRSAVQRKRDRRINLLWGIFSGIILTGIMLGIIQACSFYFGPESPYLGIGLLTYALLGIIIIFLLGLLRGRMTGRGGDGATIAFIACLIQGLIFLCLVGGFSFVFQWEQWDIISDVLLIVMLFIYQLPVGLFDGYVGGAIGSRFLYQRSKPDRVKRE